MQQPIVLMMLQCQIWWCTHKHAWVYSCQMGKV